MRKAKELGDVLSETWEMYKARVVTIGVVILVTYVVLFGAMMAMSFIVGILAIAGAGFMGVFQNLDMQNLQPAQLLPLVPVMMIFFIPLFILSLWSNAATVAVSVDEKLGIGDGLKAGFRYLWPLAWVSLLYMGIVQVGFLLLVIPGFIFMIWFLFSMIIMVEEDRRGLDALLASYYYVKGDALSVFLKMLVMIVLNMVVFVPLALIPIPFLANLIQILLVPFTMLYLVVIYRDLRERKGLADPASMGGGKVIWGSVAGIGLLLPVGILAGLLLYAPELQQMITAQMQQHGELEAVVEEGETSEWETVSTRDDGEDLAPAVHEPVAEQGENGLQVSGPEVNEVTVAEQGPEQEAFPVAQEEEGTMGPQVGIWRDPAGDTGRDGKKAMLDIVEVRAEGGGDETLHLSLKLRTPVAQFYNMAGSSLGRLATIYLDRDLNRETGKKPFGEEARGGYDIVINVMLEAISGPEGRLQVSVAEVTGRGMHFLPPLDPGSFGQEGASISLRIPYSSIGLEKGKQLRICFQELAQEQGSGLAKDKLIDL